jgi:hypothetical protein
MDFLLGGSSLAWLRLTEAKPGSQSEEKLVKIGPLYEHQNYSLQHMFLRE